MELLTGATRKLFEFAVAPAPRAPLAVSHARETEANGGALSGSITATEEHRLIGDVARVRKARALGHRPAPRRLRDTERPALRHARARGKSTADRSELRSQRSPFGEHQRGAVRIACSAIAARSPNGTDTTRAPPWAAGERNPTPRLCLFTPPPSAAGAWEG